MTDVDRLSEAVALLYGADLAEFAQARKELASAARQAGDGDAARRIEELRKPTRSAWIVNQVVRADPDVPRRLLELGDELRAAQAALDGAKLRELSRARRDLIGALARQAASLPGQPQPSAPVREEATATFDAAIADPQAARQLAEGVLLRPLRRAGFGGVGGPALALVRAPREKRTAPRAAAKGQPKPAARDGGQTRLQAAPEAGRDRRAGRDDERGRRNRAAEAEQGHRNTAVDAERGRRKAIADAERAVRAADRDAARAATAEQARERAVRRLEQGLAQARQALADAQRQSGRAQRSLQAARDALDRLTRGR